jgi:hypothetical protein
MYYIRSLFLKERRKRIMNIKPKDVAVEVNKSHEEFRKLPQYKKILYCRYVYGLLPKEYTLSYIDSL